MSRIDDYQIVDTDLYQAKAMSTLMCQQVMASLKQDVVEYNKIKKENSKKNSQKTKNCIDMHTCFYNIFLKIKNIKKTQKTTEKKNNERSNRNDISRKFFLFSIFMSNNHNIYRIPSPSRLKLIGDPFKDKANPSLSGWTKSQWFVWFYLRLFQSQKYCKTKWQKKKK